MGTAQQFVATLKAPNAQVSVANANRDGTTGTYVTVYTAPATGARFDRLDIKAQVTTTAGMIRLFRSNGTPRLWKEIPVTAITPSASVAAFQYTERDLGLVMQASEVLTASTEKGEAINIVLSEGGDY